MRSGHWLGGDREFCMQFATAIHMSQLALSEINLSTYRCHR